MLGLYTAKPIINTVIILCIVINDNLRYGSKVIIQMAELHQITAKSFICSLILNCVIVLGIEKRLNFTKKVLTALVTMSVSALIFLLRLQYLYLLFKVYKTYFSFIFR